MTGRYTIGAILTAVLAGMSAPPAPAQSRRPFRSAEPPPRIAESPDDPTPEWDPFTWIDPAWHPWFSRWPERRRETWVASEIPTQANVLAGAYLQSAPLALGGNDNLHGALLLPPLRSAWVLPNGTGEASFAFSTAANSVSESAGTDFVQMEGRFSEGVLRWRQGMFDFGELTLAVDSAGWGLDDDLILLDGGTLLPEDDEDISSEFLSNFQAGAKVRLYASADRTFAAAFAVDAKFPLPDREDTLSTSGESEVAAVAMVSWNLDPIVVHANLGYVVASEYDFPGKTEDLDDVITGGIGVAYPITRRLAVVGQAQVYSSAFGFLDGLDGPVASLQAGPRG